MGFFEQQSLTHDECKICQCQWIGTQLLQKFIHISNGICHFLNFTVFNEMLQNSQAERTHRLIQLDQGLVQLGNNSCAQIVGRPQGIESTRKRNLIKQFQTLQHDRCFRCIGTLHVKQEAGLHLKQSCARSSRKKDGPKFIGKLLVTCVENSNRSVHNARESKIGQLNHGLVKSKGPLLLVPFRIAKDCKICGRQVAVHDFDIMKLLKFVFRRVLQKTHKAIARIFIGPFLYDLLKRFEILGLPRKHFGAEHIGLFRQVLLQGIGKRLGTLVHNGADIRAQIRLRYATGQFHGKDSDIHKSFG